MGVGGRAEPGTSEPVTSLIAHLVVCEASGSPPSRMQPAEKNFPSAVSAPHGRGAHHMLLFGRRKFGSRRNWLLGAIALLLGGGLLAWLLITQFDWERISEAIDHLRPVPLVIAMCGLPLFGFPILPVYLVAGARFGPWGGGVVVTLVTAAHLVGTYVIARTVLRAPLERLLAKWHAHLPEIPRDEEPMVALIAALVPGLPYVVRNYLLAMAGLRLRVYFWICLPIYVARSYVSILVGDLSGAPSTSRLLILGGIELVKVVVCAVVIWRLREHHRRFHGVPPSDAPSPPIA
jgi:uncharacterized membrane protein YdjX (TVP38/TMEM64 family)